MGGVRRRSWEEELEGGGVGRRRRRSWKEEEELEGGGVGKRRRSWKKEEEELERGVKNSWEELGGGVKKVRRTTRSVRRS